MTTSTFPENEQIIWPRLCVQVDLALSFQLAVLRAPESLSGPRYGPSKFMPNSFQHHPKTITKSSHNHPNIIPKSFQNPPKTMSKLHPDGKGP